jgi:hypothetical protein
MDMGEAVTEAFIVEAKRVKCRDDGIGNISYILE